MKKFGLFGTMKSLEGKGKELLNILVDASNLMKEFEGCIEYAVCLDAEDADTVHIFEIWEHEEAHESSLQLHTVRELIGKAIPILSDERIPGRRFRLQNSINF